jgi:N-acetylneuraminic acid mutarotase
VDLVQGDSVTPIAPLGVPRQGAAALWVPDDGVCVLGGSRTHPNANAQPLNTVECFGGSRAARRWPDLPEPIHGAGAARIGDTVYLVGGTSGPALELRLG